ncbi:Fungalysin metallopeptidase-domain-containing protein [Schizophyllum amplum]|uniref:Extracellular metalloproteinase n=1 Tax=Schizophyllum amplum TaxID=97359 RepID=A0A550C0R1_9AGAR|nr:Fungalysin metallopeptidase-domain-containing protein [Auriculariopsis ampla]
MFSFGKMLNAVVLALACSSVNAVPWDATVKYSTHRTREISPALTIEAYHPPTTYKTFGKGLDDAHAARVKREGIEAASTAFVASQLGLDESAVNFKSGYESESAHYGYMRQAHDNVPFVNAVANVAFKDDKVVSFGNSFVSTDNIAASTPTVEIDSFISDIEAQLDGKFNDYSSLEYLAKADGTVALVHVVQIRNEDTNAWYEAMVDAHSGELVSITDFVADASYTVVPISKQDPTDGIETLSNPALTAASPYGWHGTSSTSTTTNTSGNNVVAYKGSSTSGTTSQSSSGQVFNYRYDTSVAPTSGSNVQAATVNSFYIMNSLHDISYLYGFTEAAYNFQTSNFGKGGVANDRVLMSVQDSSGTNNANFATPPDGQSGQCRMYIWTYTNPRRDGDVENDIPVHEGTHGITNRVTGGGTGRCLQTTESGGMGEGWSDAMAEWTEQTSATISDFTMGGWVTGSTAGIRSYPYSTNARTNPLRYSTIRTLNEVHDIGEVWANMLHNVYALLVGEYGFSADFKTSAASDAGNVVYMHLFIDALALQPCNPTLPTARDAWIQADENRYGGEHVCTVWTAFASRGLGVNARSYTDDTTVPAECR